MIKGVSRANIAKSGLMLNAMSWDMLEDKNYQRPSTTTHLREEYYIQDFHGEEDLMKKRIPPKFYQVYDAEAKTPQLDKLNDNSTSTNSPSTQCVRARPVAACSSWNCVRGALLANAQSQGPTSALCVLKPKIDSE